ncbi:DUF2642 domain-containing protein [Sporosarcina sp. JAI121]|uniref:DUF2642 domain-containing protein n=1 Tax=Sporosarcina sp. JAI121 TaxID=2723064 RepID=UPI0015C80C8C|nr:DUF2642 domain-containing protein [Sporosarcina sp. JAI121]NYF24936.1 ribosome maturation factor RimP [Sporosarcina sp. JAI121]
MNKIIQSLINEVVQIEVSGKKQLKGTVIDLGSDMIVLFNGIDFVYIPLVHIQNFAVDRDNEDDLKAPMEFPSIISDENNEDLTFGEVLLKAKGKYVEIYVTGGHTLHGCISSIMSDYLVFDSPIYKTMYIALSHLKWLIPYSQNEKPYGLDDRKTTIQSDQELLPNTFEVQVEKLASEIVVFNIDGNKSFIGKLNNIEGQIVEIQTARKNSIYVNLQHIKTLHKV